MTCRRCGRTAELHCPGCGTCWPDFTCTPDCDAGPALVALVAAGVDEWVEATAKPLPEQCRDCGGPLPSVITAGSEEDLCVPCLVALVDGEAVS